MPSLAAFAAERGLEDFSEREQQEAFVEAYGPATELERKSRQTNLVTQWARTTTGRQLFGVFFIVKRALADELARP